ncbi:PQQ-dependent sugar dehydrogenase [Streptomyces sp. DSM 44917]|uniref:PQQ-dependent sugar dehydrogenase n=1 Tax=Streptomyces boetiae TaxID=3075541 RepID=A0ABU2LDN7_9ACTN|nr:PQQ-dependent sugar dehydrogenase [Streptomyces sp. DSM 44917]MDT0309611.1 PQQ-dependent sugar dehydrogenase [Streptomyces sp. DSM 44917]
MGRGERRRRCAIPGALAAALAAALLAGCSVGPAERHAASLRSGTESEGPGEESPGEETDDPRVPEDPAESSPPPPSSAPPPTAAPEEGTAEVTDTVDIGSEAECCLAALGDGAFLTGVRDTGAISLVDAEGGITELGFLPSVAAGDGWQMLGLAAQPGLADGDWIYAYVRGPSTGRILRFPYDASGGESPQLSPSQLAPVFPAPAGDGVGVLAFGPDGMLYVGTGEGEGELAGAVLRMEPDGDMPEGQDSYVYSSGYTDPRGLAWDGDRMWAVDGGEGTRLYSVVPGAEPALRWESEEETAAGLAEDRGVLWVPVGGDGTAALLRFPLEGVELVREEPQRLLDGGELGAPQGAAAVGAGELWVPTDDGVLRVEVE